MLDPLEKADEELRQGAGRRSAREMLAVRGQVTIEKLAQAVPHLDTVPVSVRETVEVEACHQ